MKRRFQIFLTGMVLGSLIGYCLVLRHRQSLELPAFEHTGRDEVEKGRLEAIANLLRVYRKYPVALRSPFIKEEESVTRGDFTQRSFIVEGRLEWQTFLVKETLGPRGELLGLSLASADRLEVKLSEKNPDIAQLNLEFSPYTFLYPLDSNYFLVKIPQKGHEGLKKAKEDLLKHPQVLSVRPNHLAETLTHSLFPPTLPKSQ